MRPPRPLGVALLAAILLALTLPFAPPAAAADGLVRLVNGAAAVGPLDLYLDGDRIATRVPFAGASGYAAIPAGAHRLRVFPTDAGEPTIDTIVTVASGSATTIAVTGDETTLAATVLADDLAPRGDGRGRLRLANLADGPTLDLAVQRTPIVLNGLRPGDASDPLAIAAGTYDLTFRTSGGATLLTLGSLTVAEDQVYSIVILSAGAAGALQVVAIDDTAPTAAALAGARGSRAQLATSPHLATIGWLTVAAIVAFGLLRPIGPRAR